MNDESEKPSGNSRLLPGRGPEGKALQDMIRIQIIQYGMFAGNNTELQYLKRYYQFVASRRSTAHTRNSPKNCDQDTDDVTFSVTKSEGNRKEFFFYLPVRFKKLQVKLVTDCRVERCELKLFEMKAYKKIFECRQIFAQKFRLLNQALSPPSFSIAAFRNTGTFSRPGMSRGSTFSLVPGALKRYFNPVTRPKTVRAVLPMYSKNTGTWAGDGLPTGAVTVPDFTCCW